VVVGNPAAAPGQALTKPSVAQHPDQYLSQIGRFIRRNEQDTVAVAENLGQAPNPRGNHRNTE